MKLKNGRISVCVSKTINIGNFESEKIEYGIETDIVDSKDAKEELAGIYDELNEMANSIKHYIKSGE